MAALWIHTGCLLVLLVMSCPGSQAVASQHLCGSDLVDALYLVCGDSGFTFYAKRDSKASQRFLPPNPASVGGEDEVARLAAKDRRNRSIVDNCCFRPCTMLDLQDYCY